MAVPVKDFLLERRLARQEDIFLENIYFSFPSHLCCPEEAKLSWQQAFKVLFRLPRLRPACSRSFISCGGRFASISRRGKKVHEC